MKAKGSVSNEGRGTLQTHLGVVVLLHQLSLIALVRRNAILVCIVVHLVAIHIFFILLERTSTRARLPLGRPLVLLRVVKAVVRG